MTNETEKTKIVYNACYGGFGISDVAFEALLDLKGIKWDRKEIGSTFADNYSRKGVSGKKGMLCKRDFFKDRKDVDLVAVVEKLGEAADGTCAALRVVEIEKGIRYRIDEYDGFESVMTVDDYEWSIA